MPGDSPREAFDAFVEPLQQAVSCLGPAKIAVSAGGKDVPGKVHAWSLNREAGHSKAGFHLEAEMHYEIIQDGRPGYGPFRVTTRGYRYKIARLGIDIVRLHWHPTGFSSFVHPHVHVAMSFPTRMGEPPVDTIGRHMQTPRMTFEDAISWAAELGMPMARDDWQDVLQKCQEAHLEHRSWS